MAGDEHSNWAPLSVAEVPALFGCARFPWWVAGGWAIDLFVGRQTRAHGDIEIVALRRDHQAVREILAGWDGHTAPGDGTLKPWRPGEALPADVHNTWWRPSPDAPWALQVLIEEAEGDEWIYRRDQRVTMPLSTFGGRTSDGVPYVAPEVQLLYKSKGRRERDEADLDVTLPLLGPERRQWLRAALSTGAPGHPWIDRLD